MVEKKYEFVATENYTKKDIKKVQQILMVMAKAVCGILEKHDIKYFIIFGTLLGAVRHSGFIPWDDDFDLFVFEEDYDKALECLRKELPEWMVVQDENTDPVYAPYWARVRDLNSASSSEVYLDDNLYKFTGVNIDLYRLKPCKKGHADLSIYKENLEYYERKYKLGLLDAKVYKEKIAELEVLIKEEEDKVKHINTTEEMYYFIAFNKKFEKEQIFPLCKYKFEDCEFWGPNDAEYFLTDAYGDYMNPPEMSKRKPHRKEVKYFDENFDYGIK